METSDGKGPKQQPQEPAQGAEPVVGAAPPPPPGVSPTAPTHTTGTRTWIVGGVVVLGVGLAIAYVIVDRQQRAARTAERIEAEAAEARALRDQLAAQAELDRETARVRREAGEERRRQQRLAREEADVALERVVGVMTEELSALTDDPAFIRFVRANPRLRDAESEEEIRRIAVEISADGFARLPDGDLAELNRLQLLVAQGDEVLCGQLWTGERATARQLLNALAMLPDDDLRAWFRLSARAMRTQIDRPGPLPAVDEEALSEGLEGIAERLDPPDAARFRAILASDERVSEADGCFALTSILRETENLPRPLRARFARAYLVSEASE